ncbi:MAG: replication-associated recombination protein A [Clostridia bacterium]|nr:replication-associated recombination protein A [Clostridia bacterium]
MEQPLAYRMKPKTLEDFFGQKHIVGENKLLYRLIKADRLTSAIFWGPPGCGKTSLARVIASTTKHKFVELNATNAGVSDIKKIAEEASNLFLNPTGKTICFIDEIHRFNKLQQDSLLPLVEKGIIILIGATTENPYFEVNAALVSRSTVFKLEPLGDEDIVEVLKHALGDKENGLGMYNIDISEDVIKYIAQMSDGDVRTALNAMEVATITTKMDQDGKITITEDIVRDSMQQKKMHYDKDSNEHYDTISAFIKSMRGSDVDATLLYLAKMIAAGEDPKFIARRIVICAAEDVGLANPNALVVANAAMEAVAKIGMPEGRIILAEAAVLVAKSRKSNSAYLGINNALAEVENGDIGQIPIHIRNAPISDMKKHGYNNGYKYPHDYENGMVEQQYLPDKLKDKKFYFPKEWEAL